MNVEQLIDKLNGHKVGGRAIARVNGRHVVIGKNVDGTYALTEEGKALVVVEGAEEAEFEEVKPKRTRRTKVKIEADNAKIGLE